MYIDQKAIANVDHHTETIDELQYFRVFLLFAAHVPLALLMNRFASLATLHAYLLLVVGLWYAASGRQLTKVMYIGSYFVGAEVLWRMTDANVFWEFGKYGMCAVFVMAMLRIKRQKRILPFFYFLLLLPSVPSVYYEHSFRVSRQLISFNLSGPFALMVCILFFSNLKLSKEQLYRILIFLIAPVIGVASIAISSTLSATFIRFTDQSNFVTSGKFGPNQVSAVLGLCTFLSLFFLLDRKINKNLKLLMFCIMLVCATMSALTFSRGGLYMALAATMVASLYLLRESFLRKQILILAGILLCITIGIIAPRLDAFTRGRLSERFADNKSTGRDIEMRDELRVWKEHPLLGVGPGRSIFYRGQFSFFLKKASHTEFTRALAEHGIFGLAAYLILFLIALQNIKRARTSNMSMAVVASMLVWTGLFMSINAMRLVAPAFTFGITSATLFPEEQLLEDS